MTISLIMLTKLFYSFSNCVRYSRFAVSLILHNVSYFFTCRLAAILRHGRMVIHVCMYDVRLKKLLAYLLSILNENGYVIPMNLTRH